MPEREPYSQGGFIPPTLLTGQQTVPSAARPPRSTLRDTIPSSPYTIGRPEMGSIPPVRVLAERCLARLPLGERMAAAWRIIRRRPA
ncbi:hypothetical protein AB0B88_16360 [Micromonospora haikouensis]|uniref:hypothetical protein n=1 Tax=Micromonospora haikouensis TaxID=686309 RepID=UPI0033F527E4